MANIFDWSSEDDNRDLVHIVVQALVEGKLVALPAETAYHVFASALKPEAVSEVQRLADEKLVGPPSIFLRAPKEALDYSPDMSPVAIRAVNRGWPGPLVLELPIDSEGSLAHKLPESVLKFLSPKGDFLAQRVAAHSAIREAMHLMAGPLVAAPMISADAAAVFKGSDAGEKIGSNVALVVDDGVTHYKGFATAIRVDGNRCTVVTDGVLDEQKLDQLFQLIILLVCTGNTCRSPMAEVILRDLLTKKFPDQMGESRQAAHVASAGLSAFPGGPASDEAQRVVKKRGLNLGSHQSRSVTERSIRHADFVLTMTRSHKAAILERLPEYAYKISLLSNSEDISDPFGGSESIYSDCADQIEANLKEWIGQVDDSWLPHWQTV